MSSDIRSKSDADSHVPLHIRRDVMMLTSLWQDKQSFGSKLFKKFSQAQDPYLYFLDLICFVTDPKKNHLSLLTEAIFSDFEKWLKQNTFASCFLTLPMKQHAFDRVLSQKNCSLIPAVVSVFQMDKDSDALKEIIDRHLVLGCYKQVCFAITALNLQHLYKFEQIVYPLLFQDKLVLVNIYFDNHPDLQLLFAQHLDAVSESVESTAEFIRSINLPTGTKVMRKDKKWMQKMLINFIKTHNISVDKCPKLVKSRTHEALNYLFRKRFIEGTMNNDSWKEMVLVTIADQPSLKAELLTKLICVDEFELALEMADLLKLPSGVWPSALISYSQNNLSREFKIKASIETAEETRDHKVKSNIPNCYLTLKLNDCNIVLVNDLELFESCLGVISTSYDVIGFDAEWRPSMGLSEDEVISILQLATWDNVYLLDIPALSKCLNAKHWDGLMEKVFSNSDILKLGYGLHTDLDLLRKVIKGTNANHSFSYVVDFAKLFPHLTHLHPNIIKALADNRDSLDTSDADNKGLSKLCQDVLGKPLDKVEQFSDWERRPLRPTQVTYAALDAYCLLLLYEKLFDVLKEMDLDLQTIIRDFLTKKPCPAIPKETSTVQHCKLLEEPPTIQYPPTPISQFKVLVDNSLFGVGKQLRIRGADVLILGDSANVHQLIKVAQEEGDRIVISRGSRCEKAKSNLPYGMCFDIPFESNTTADQVNLVCKHFNIVCTEEDIFRRCTICNCDQYLEISSQDMELLVATKPSCSIDPQNSQMEPFIQCTNGFVTEEAMMHTGVEIQLRGLTHEILSQNLLFFVCSRCGKVYWEGSHHRRTRETVANWINNSEATPNKPSSSKNN